MTRVADAIRRYRGLAFGASGAPETLGRRVEDTQAWTTAEIPWDLDDAPASPSPSPSIGSESLGVKRPPDITSGRSRGALDGGRGYREQLAPIVRCMLQDGPAETRIRSLLFTAIGPEHSGSLCAATAEALSHQTPGSVCLLDCNLRSPSLHASFGLSGMPGISELLLQRGNLRACLARLTPNLWLLPAGGCCAEAVPVLSGEQMRGHLRDVLTTFDYVLVDTSAASVHSDAVALGALVDGVVLVIGANATRREVAKRSIDHLHAAKVKVLGAILTNRAFPIPETIYRML